MNKRTRHINSNNYLKPATSIVHKGYARHWNNCLGTNSKNKTVEGDWGGGCTEKQC